MRVHRPFGITLLRTPEGLALYDVASRRSWEGAALAETLLAEVLVFCDRWREQQIVNLFVAALAQVEREVAEAAVDELIHAGILVTEKDALHKYILDEADIWCHHGWEAPLLFHLHTNLLPKMDYEVSAEAIVEDVARMRAYLAEEKPPDNYKDYTRNNIIPLPNDVKVKQRSLADVFTHSPAAWSASGSFSLAEFAWLTYLAYGQTAMCRLPVTGKHVAKTSPSGGSRHPVEVYPVVMSVDGLEAGVYHYSVRHHALEPILAGDCHDFIQEHVIIHEGRPTFEPAVVYLYTSLFERSMFRYRESRSYRVIHHDLGHLMQNTAFLASALGRPSYRGYSLHDSAVEEFLGTDAMSEAAIAFTVIG